MLWLAIGKGTNRLRETVQYSGTVLQNVLGVISSRPSAIRRLPIKKSARSRKKAKSSRLGFDVKSFLDSTDWGGWWRSSEQRKRSVSQGDRAKNVMYIQEGGVRLTVVNKSGREAVVAILGGIFSARAALRGTQ